MDQDRIRYREGDVVYMFSYFWTIDELCPLLYNHVILYRPDSTKEIGKEMAIMSLSAFYKYTQDGTLRKPTPLELILEGS
jgi:hypothetical protein